MHLRLHGNRPLPEQQPRRVDCLAEVGQAAVEEAEGVGAVLGRREGGDVELEVGRVEGAEEGRVVRVEGLDVGVEFLLDDGGGHCCGA